MRLAKKLATEGVGSITRLCKTGLSLTGQGGSEGRLLTWQALDHILIGVSLEP